MQVQCGPHIVSVNKTKSIPTGIEGVVLSIANIQTTNIATVFITPEEARQLRDNLDTALKD